MPPDWAALADRLGNELAACSLVTPAQWREALARAGGPPACRNALDLLSRARASWAAASDPTPPRALTDYQKARVAEWLHAPDDPFPRDELVWNDYLLLEKAGEGGMGTVFKAWDRTDARYVAIKRTHGDSADIRNRLAREANLLRQLTHPNIARFYAREEFGDTDLLVMEYLHGDTLGEVVRKRMLKKSPIPWPAVAEWAVELLDALEHLNGRNPARVVVVHRDVKPANVLLEQHGDRYRARLMDLGLGTTLTPQLSSSQSARRDEPMMTIGARLLILGTPEYMAPEQWDGGEYAIPASDLYGLGGTLYSALTGRVPFGIPPGDTPKKAAMLTMAGRHRSDPRPSAAEYRPDIPKALDALLRRMMAVHPAHRGTAADLRDDFRRLLRERPPAGSGESSPLNSASVAEATPTPREPESSTPETDNSPTTGAVVCSFRDWLGAVFRGRPSAGRLGREFRRRCGAWFRTFTRPLECPFRWVVVLTLVGLLGWAAGWGWGVGLVVLFAGMVGFAHLLDDE